MKYTLQKNTRGLIFDLDGTLANTMPFHFEAWQLTCNDNDMEMTRSFLQSHMGRPGWEIAEDIITEHNLSNKIDPERLFKQKIQRYKTLEHKVTAIEPVARIVNEYLNEISMAIGTGGFREAAHNTLSIIGMGDMFEIVVTANDVSNHKPHPETFLKCAELMKIEPSAIDVFEDGDLGIEAAKRAGMNPIDVRPWINSW